MKSLKTLFVLLAVTLALGACTSTKKIIYFQGSDSLFRSPQAINQLYELHIKPADRISVTLTCSEEELLKPFAQNIVVGTAQGFSDNIRNTRDIYVGYVVDRDGYVNLPVIGKVMAAGLTEEGLARKIEQEIISSGTILDPQVTVKFADARVAVLGEVGKPGVYSLSSERESILDILARAGDINGRGIKTNIKLYREVDGKERQMYELDITKAEVFNSPAFYLQQNDLIYVEPNKSVVISNSPFFTFWRAAATITSLIMSLTTFILVTRKRLD